MLFCYKKMKRLILGDIYEIIENFMYVLEENDFIILPSNV